jgi:hypothetical protein
MSFPLMYLQIYVFELVDLCKDAKVSYSMLQNAIIQQLQRPPQISDDNTNFMEEMNKFNTNRRYGRTLGRVALHSFILAAANSCKIIWPYTDAKTKEPEKSRKEKRRQDLDKFFPTSSYPNLKNKQFRNFLEHFDERLDTWDATSQNHNIAMDWMGEPTTIPTGNITVMQNFDPTTFKITYYHETKGTETTDLKDLYEETERLRLELPNVLGVIRGTPADHYKSIVDI